MAKCQNKFLLQLTQAQMVASAIKKEILYSAIETIESKKLHLTLSLIHI